MTITRATVEAQKTFKKHYPTCYLRTLALMEGDGEHEDWSYLAIRIEYVEHSFQEYQEVIISVRDFDGKIETEELNW